MKNKKEWYKELIDSLRIFSDINFQEKTWILGEGKYVFSFAEAVCQLFDDTALSYYLEDPSFLLISYENTKDLKQINSLLEKIDEKSEISKIVYSDEMNEIRKLSKKIISELKKSI